jgi:hypothetical protein
MMIVVVVMHMLQVFLWAPYKRPREATWMAGVGLLLLTLAYGLTGYLLPWDNRAYWGTVVTTQIASQAPVLGPYLSRLLGGEGAIGVVTFARFYGMHVLLLPPVTTLLIVLHVYLVRKHGVAPRAGRRGSAAKKILSAAGVQRHVAIFIAFVILFVMAVVVRIPLERLADPTDTTYIPRPEWYFLFLFQILKSIRRAAGGIRQRRAARAGDAGPSAGAVHRPEQDGKSFEAYRGHHVRRTCDARMDGADGDRDRHDAQAGRRRNRLLRSHRLDGAHAAGDGGYRLFPQGELQHCHTTGKGSRR